MSSNELVAYLGCENGIEDYEVDHVFPLSAYDWKSTSTQSMATHYTNMQLLSRNENIDKFDKLLEQAHKNQITEQ